MGVKMDSGEKVVNRHKHYWMMRYSFKSLKEMIADYEFREWCAKESWDCAIEAISEGDKDENGEYSICLTTLEDDALAYKEKFLEEMMKILIVE